MRQHQAAFFATGKEGMNPQSCVAQDKIGARGGTVADTQPDDFGRTTEEETSLRKIRILAGDGEAVFRGVLQTSMSDAPRRPQSRRWTEPG